MAELSCQQCHELTAELALDVLEGRERADALAHLHGCQRCQDRVSAMATTADRLVELLPAAEPPPGFDQRVVAAITRAAPPAVFVPAWWRTPAAAMVLAGALLGGSGWLYDQLGQNGPSSTNGRASTQYGQPTQVMVAALRSGEHEVGRAYLYPENPSWLMVSISEDDLGGPSGAAGPSPPSTLVNCELVRQDGSTIALGGFPLHAGRIDWATRAPVDRTGLVGAKITTTSGNTLASAQFTPIIPAPEDTDVGQQRDHPHPGEADLHANGTDNAGAASDHSDEHHSDEHHGDKHRDDERRGDRQDSDHRRADLDPAKDADQHGARADDGRASRGRHDTDGHNNDRHDNDRHTSTGRISTDRHSNKHGDDRHDGADPKR